MCESTDSENVPLEAALILPNERIRLHAGDNRSSDEDEPTNPRLTFGIDRLLSLKTHDRQHGSERERNPPPYHAGVQLYGNQGEKLKQSDSECCDECRGDSSTDSRLSYLLGDLSPSTNDQARENTDFEGACQANRNESSADLQLHGTAEDYPAYGFMASEYDRRVPKLILKPLPVRIGHGTLGCGIFSQHSSSVMTTFPHGPTPAYLGAAQFDNVPAYSMEHPNDGSTNASSKPRANDYTVSSSRPGGQTSISRRKRSWSRAVFSTLQRKGLERTFQEQKYITKPDRKRLAANLGLHDAQVKVWFQNRRMKWRHTVKSSSILPPSMEKQPDKKITNNTVEYEIRSKDYSSSVADILTLSINEDSEDIEVIID